MGFRQIPPQGPQGGAAPLAQTREGALLGTNQEHRVLALQPAEHAAVHPHAAPLEVGEGPIADQQQQGDESAQRPAATVRLLNDRAVQRGRAFI